jgi:hypothetical protein
MRPHVFLAKPKFCVALKPGLIKVRCPKCGHPHYEYFGPKNRDEAGAEMEMLRGALDRAFAILAKNGGNGSGRRRARSSAARSTAVRPARK